MQNLVGVWVSRGQAKIVNLTPDGQSQLLTLESKVESRRKSTGGAPSRVPYAHGGVSAPKQSERLTNQLHDFYCNILQRIHSAEKIYVLGPGLAKKELQKEMKKRKNFLAKLAAVESSDKMTDPQLVARVKTYYGIAN